MMGNAFSHLYFCCDMLVPCSTPRFLGCQVFEITVASLQDMTNLNSWISHNIFLMLQLPTQCASFAVICSLVFVTTSTDWFLRHIVVVLPPIF